MSGALLSEVWPDMVVKTKKKKKRNRTTGDILDITPLTPGEMETELLEDNVNEDLNPNRKLTGMRVSPYTGNESMYQDIKRKESYNDNVVRANDTKRTINNDSDEDPEYQEFREFKRMKLEKERIQKAIVSPNEQFNELLLYVFTGFFLLMIYDGIYKLGRNQY